MEITYSKRFIKKFKKCSPQIKKAFHERLEIFINDKNSVILNNHKLSGKLADCRSININADWRVIFEEITKENINFYFKSLY